jgi:hypothetical protein
MACGQGLSAQLGHPLGRRLPLPVPGDLVTVRDGAPRGSPITAARRASKEKDSSSNKNFMTFSLVETILSRIDKLLAD